VNFRVLLPLTLRFCSSEYFSAISSSFSRDIRSFCCFSWRNSSCSNWSSESNLEHTTQQILHIPQFHNLETFNLNEFFKAVVFLREHSAIKFILKVEAPDFCETLITIYHTTHCHNPNDKSWYFHWNKNVSCVLINTASFNAYLCTQITHCLLYLTLPLKFHYFSQHRTYFFPGQYCLKYECVIPVHKAGVSKNLLNKMWLLLTVWKIQ